MPRWLDFGGSGDAADLERERLYEAALAQPDDVLALKLLIPLEGWTPTRFDPRLLALADVIAPTALGDTFPGWPAIALAGRCEEPRVRVEAMKRAEADDWFTALSLLVANARDEDVALVRAAARRSGVDRGVVHSECEAAIEIGRGPSGACDTVREAAARMVYERTPCSYCRAAAVDVLERLDRVPRWMSDESRLNADAGRSSKP